MWGKSQEGGGRNPRPERLIAGVGFLGRGGAATPFPPARGMGSAVSYPAGAGTEPRKM